MSILENDNILEIDNKDELACFFDKISFEGPEGKTIMFTNGNSWYVETLILNLLVSYHLHNIKNKHYKNLTRPIAVLCSDDDALKKANELNMLCCYVSCKKLNVENAKTQISNKEYTSLCFVKILVISFAISLGYTVLYIDPDMSFNVHNKYNENNFIDEMLNRQGVNHYIYDELIQNYAVIKGTKKFDNSINDETTAKDLVIASSILIFKNFAYVYLNSNLMLVKPTEESKKIFNLSYNEFNKILETINYGGDEDFLRPKQKCNSFLYWEQSLYPPGSACKKFKDVAIMFHANCARGLIAKKQLLLECGGWFLPILEYTTLANWQNIVKPENQLIVQASLEDGSDGETSCTIGMSYQYVNQKDNFYECQIGKHNLLVLCAIKEHTDSNRRGSSLINRKNIIKTLEKNNITNINIPENEYYKSLPNYKFIISPEGNGIDCHRHYEALMAGCIPIVEDNILIRTKYKDCPMLYTKDYSEITEEYLNKKYEEMLDKVYCFKMLFLGNFSMQERNIIKSRGNFWCKRVTGKEWYQSV